MAKTATPARKIGQRRPPEPRFTDPVPRTDCSSAARGRAAPVRRGHPRRGHGAQLVGWAGAATAARGDVACWVLKSTAAPEAIAAAWQPGTEQLLERCVRRSYRLGAHAARQPCLLWVSGRRLPGGARAGRGHLRGRPRARAVRWSAVRLTRLGRAGARAPTWSPTPRPADAEVVRMPAGSNPSWLSAAQYAAVLGHLPVRGSAART